MENIKSLQEKRDRLMGELLDVCYDLEDMECYQPGSKTSVIINDLQKHIKISQEMREQKPWK